MHSLHSPLQAQIVQWLIAPGATVRAGEVVVILEAMKMEHEVRVTADGRVAELLFTAGEMVNEGEVLLISERLTHVPPASETKMASNSDAMGSASQATPPTQVPRVAPPRTPQPGSPSDPVRPDLQRLRDRHAFTADASLPDALAKRHAQGLRSAMPIPAIT